MALRALARLAGSAAACSSQQLMGRTPTSALAEACCSVSGRGLLSEAAAAWGSTPSLLRGGGAWQQQVCVGGHLRAVAAAAAAASHSAPPPPHTHKHLQLSAAQYASWQRAATWQHQQHAGAFAHRAGAAASASPPSPLPALSHHHQLQQRRGLLGVVKKRAPVNYQVHNKVKAKKNKIKTPS